MRRIERFIRFTSVQYNAPEWEIFAFASHRAMPRASRAAQHERGNAIRRHANPCTGSMLNFQGGLQPDQRQSDGIFDKAIFWFVHSAARFARKRRRSRRVSGVSITGSPLSIGKLIIRPREKPVSRKPKNFRARTMWLRVPLMLRRRALFFALSVHKRI